MVNQCKICYVQEKLNSSLMVLFVLKVGKIPYLLKHFYIVENSVAMVGPIKVTEVMYFQLKYLVSGWIMLLSHQIKTITWQFGGRHNGRFHPEMQLGLFSPILTLVKVGSVHKFSHW